MSSTTTPPQLAASNSAHRLGRADEVNQPIPDYLKTAREEGIADLRALIAKGSYLY